MAVGKNGYFDITGTKSFSARVTWEETYDISTNQSIVSITKLQISSKYAAVVYYLNGYIRVGDDDVVTFNAFQGTHSVYILNDEKWSTVNGDNSAPWKSDAITHNSDGSKSITISISITGEGGSSGNGWSVEGSQEIVLTTIPRASTLTLSKTSVDVGSSIIANISRASSSFTHTVEFYINGTYYEKFTDVGTSQSFMIPTSWYNYMSSSTSCTAYCRITTYNSGTQIGDQARQSFTVLVPSNIKPSIGTIILDPDDINGNNILVKGKNKLTMQVSGCSAGAGSTIKSYTFSGPSINITTTDTSVSASSVSSTGDLTYTVTVTDNRGRTSSDTKTIYCYDYYSPSFSSFNAYRADSDGSPNVNGSYLMFVYTTKYASVNSTNDISVVAYYNGNTAPASNGELLIDLNGDTDTTYKVYLKITDLYGGSSASSTISVFGKTRVFNISSDGTGVAIGKMSEESELFECRWNAKFDGTASGPSGFSTSSDERVKKNIQDINVDIVDNLRPIQYELIQSTDGKTHYGFIAQDVERLLYNVGLNPETTGIIGHIANNGRQEYVLTYTEFIPLLTKKCQDLQHETNILKQEIAELKDIIKQITS